MRAFAARLRERGIAAIWTTLEASQGVTETAEAEPVWLEALEQGGKSLPLSQQAPAYQSFLPEFPGTRLSQYLRAWSAKLTVPLVLLLDEADVISGPALISFLRQLRAGFSDRGIGKFPTSVTLIGMRDLRDYLTQSKDGVSVNPGSPFNIKASSLTLRNFTLVEVGELYTQHTQDTGQIFTSEAIQKAFEWTSGQPFLVNALARICVMDLAPAGEAITETLIDQAKEQLILSRTTHLDALGERLKEARVARVIQGVLLGDMQIPYDHDDYQYCVDLGLIATTRQGAVIACPLYREVLVRELTYAQQLNLPLPWWKWQKPDGSLDMPALVDAFLGWWRLNEKSVYAHGNKQYPEALPHLSFMAFLQRVLNGGGQIHREFAAGRGAIDLVVEFGGKHHAIELKRVVDRPREEIVEAGCRQLAGYLDTLNEPSGWLLVFDQHVGVRELPWEQRLWREDRVVEGKMLFLRGA
jgi:hypothetical protein